MNSVKVKAAPADRIAHRIRTRTATVGIVGLGYVGLPLAEALALAGYSVTGFDTDARKIDALNRGDSYIRHIDSVRVQALNESGKFQVTSEADEFAGTDVVIICVPTPLTDAREPDLSCVIATGKMLARRLRPGQLIILESTTYPGTTDELLRPVLEQSGLVAGRDFFLAFSPEREDPGNDHFNTRTIPKVVGGIDDRSRDLAADLYAAVIDDVVPVSDARVAEACKILENTYRAVNIALVNELKVVFDAMNIDIWEVIRAARTKPFGFQPFYPGPGLGGHCIPIDPFYLTWAARRVGVNTKFIELAGEVNTQMPQYVVRRTSVALNGHGKPVKGSSIAVLGVAYKKDVDDPRESPAFAIIEALEELGAEVSYHDPFVPTLKVGKAGERLTSQPLTNEYLESQDCVIIVTDHSTVDYRQLVRHSRLVIDTRNATAGISDEGCQIVKA
ncbi:MAG: nucleotide sugar dehydrogenase [Gemmataceae bacterium]|nr:nucleotide sugar dehydrogenase [Gemmataceae bacterium]